MKRHSIEHILLWTILVLGVWIFGMLIGALIVSTTIKPVVEVRTKTETVPVIRTEVITQPVEVIVEVPVTHIPDDYADLMATAKQYHEAQWARDEYATYIREQFPVAEQVWSFLVDEMGLNTYVAAGIMGNIMNECAGNTLALQPLIYGRNHAYYGICQWTIAYHPTMDGATLEEQLNYLRSTMCTIFDQYGYLYKKGFTYADFCALTDCGAAADAFRVVYERPSSVSASTRRYNAYYAYSLFVYSE